MERIKIFRIKKRLVNTIIAIGLILLLFGISLMVYSSFNGFENKFLGGIWNYIIYLSQGIIFILIGVYSLKNDKFFIEWNQKELRYLLPESKKVEIINLSEIKKVDFQLFEVKITLSESEKLINLANIEFKELTKLKSKFEEIKRNSKLEADNAFVNKN